MVDGFAVAMTITLHICGKKKGKNVKENENKMCVCHTIILHYFTAFHFLKISSKTESFT